MEYGNIVEVIIIIKSQLCMQGPLSCCCHCNDVYLPFPTHTSYEITQELAAMPLDTLTASSEAATFASTSTPPPMR